MPRKPGKRKAKVPARAQYGALPYRFTPDAALEFLLVTTRQTRRWIIPKGWPIKGLTPPKSAAREAFEEAGVSGRVGARPIGTFTYGKLIDEEGPQAICKVQVYPLLVKRQSDAFSEAGQRALRWVDPVAAAVLIEEAGLKKLVASFTRRVAVAASKASV